jgi:hypothetical protein
MKPLLLIGLAATLAGCADTTYRYYDQAYATPVENYYPPPPNCPCEPQYYEPRYPRPYRQGGYYDPSGQY